MAHVAISKEQIETLRWQIREGTSALFVITDEADLDRIGERFRGLSWVLIDTNLTDVERARRWRHSAVTEESAGGSAIRTRRSE